MELLEDGGSSKASVVNGSDEVRSNILFSGDFEEALFPLPPLP